MSNKVMMTKISILSVLAVVIVISGCSATKVPISSGGPGTTTAPSTSVSQTTIASPVITTTSTPPTTMPPAPVVTPSAPVPTFTQLGDPPDTVYTVRILLADGLFAPNFVTVPAGTKIVWWTTEHWVDQTLRLNDGTVLGTPFLFRALEVFFNTPGTYNYYDDFSPWVKGTIVVY